MKPKTRTLATIAMLAIAAGCEGTSPPNAGLTNGPPPAFAPEKPAVRTDVPGAGIPDRGNALGTSGDRSTSPEPATGGDQAKPPGS